ncbi:MAG: hypothetical protein B7W98_00560 [Parcubacteria group bacterium 20-58-5]|nr:MAG: hypothetical protein B7W98_00560 [Parcubacteria group bacterium 20-58-5]OYV63493.1 MAG: hypothetical protein B7X03_01605 [Parcubacteria group bacterium 21-58-10]OYV83137.1 MAG: hypothetical protein B7W96_00570 [Parcubacteria group bacterium 37-58-5]HQT82677.1 hypothetical protein [Candidatus Paceibacterota bacterium]
MSDIQFDSEQEFSRPTLDQGPKGLEGLVIRSGLAKNHAGAQKTLVIIAVLAIVTAILIQVL